MACHSHFCKHWDTGVFSPWEYCQLAGLAKFVDTTHGADILYIHQNKSGTWEFSIRQHKHGDLGTTSSRSSFTRRAQLQEDEDTRPVDRPILCHGTAHVHQQHGLGSSVDGCTQRTAFLLHGREVSGFGSREYTIYKIMREHEYCREDERTEQYS